MNKAKVELVALTQPYGRTEVDVFDNGICVNPLAVSEKAACVCYDSEPSETFKVAKGCMASGHMSVMEHISFTFHVTGVSRALLAQLSRHRHISLSVRSQRYCTEDGFDFVNPFPEGDIKYTALDTYAAVTQEYYDSLLEMGAKAEDARSILPNACCTELYMTANARTLIEMARLRLCTRAQKEIRQLFQAIKDEVAKACPEVAAKMVPMCERYPNMPFCTEHNSCGKHPKLKDVYHPEN